MIPGLPFATFRWTILTLAVLAQIYLFFRARQTFRSSRRSELFKNLSVAGRMVRSLVRLYRRMAKRPAPTSFSGSRRLFLQAGTGGLFAVPLLLCGYGAAYAGRYAVVRTVVQPSCRPLWLDTT